MRYFLDITYDGTAYHGWQRQPDSITVQEVLEEALSTLLRSEITVTGAGRTDAGVHAAQLIVHVDLDEHLDEAKSKHWVHRLNRYLPQDIAVNHIQAVQATAHARFDACERSYEYLIHQSKNPFLVKHSFFYEKALDVELMNTAAKLLLGSQDFKCFSRSNTDVKTYLCAIKEAKWVVENKQLVFKITADRFLRNMVRAVVGTLLEVGLKKIEPLQLKEIIASRDRSQAGASAPAHGLYLTAVRYPKEIYNTYGRE